MKQINWREKATLSVSNKLRNDFGDYDYLDQLTPKEFEWLYRFHCEYLQADFSHAGPKIHRKKKQRLSCYAMNNERNRDVYAISKATFNLYCNPEVKTNSDKDQVVSYMKLNKLWERILETEIL